MLAKSSRGQLNELSWQRVGDVGLMKDLGGNLHHLSQEGNKKVGPDTGKMEEKRGGEAGGVHHR